MKTYPDSTKAARGLSAIEALEARIAPAAVIALDDANNLIAFDHTTPETLYFETAVTGVGAGETLRGIDFRPANGLLYALTQDAGDTGRLYTINLSTGAATLVSTLAADPNDTTVPNPYQDLDGTVFGIDFNPVPDRLRIVSNTGQNLRVNVDTGLTQLDVPLAYAGADAHAGDTPTVVGSAYTNSAAGVTSTTLYGIDTTNDTLVTQLPPNDGVLNTVADLTTDGLPFDITGVTGFDILAGSNLAVAAVISPFFNVSEIHTVNLTTGVLTFQGFFDPDREIVGLSLIPGDLTRVKDSTWTYRDLDGDITTVKVGLGTLDPRNFSLVARGVGAHLQMLDLTALEFENASVTISAKRGPLGGDGLANLGYLNATLRDLGAVSIKGDLAQIDAGDINPTDPAITSLSVRSMGILGLATQGAGGSLQSDISGPLGKLTVTGDIKDAFINVTGGTDGRTGPITISGSLIGGVADNSGSIVTTGDIGAVKITHNIIGGNGADSGLISSGGKLTSATVGGSLFGGRGENSASIRSGGDMGAVKITGSLYGVGENSGAVNSSGKLTSATIGGSIWGGAGDLSGSIFGELDTGAVKVGGDLTGSSGESSGVIFGNSAKLTSVTIGGSVVGGAGSNSGQIFGEGDVGAIKIARSLVGGAALGSGSIFGNSKIASVTIGGSVVGGGANDTGVISSDDELGAVKITGDLRGGNATGAASVERTGSIKSLDRIAGITIGGSIISGIDASTGTLTDSGSIRAGDDIGAISVKGSLVGNVGDGTAANLSRVLITARGLETPLPANTKSDLAIKSVTIGGRVDRAQILAGYDTASTPNAANGNASIGAVKVGADWIASDLVAGVQDDGDTVLDDPFGDADDQVGPGATALIARIASITIGGQVFGTSATGDRFGFVAEQIGSFKALGIAVPLTASANVVELSPVTGDVTIRDFA